MIGLGKLLAIFVSALSISGAAAAADLLFLSEDVPAGLDYDGAGAAIPTSQTGMVNLMEPLIYYPTAGVNDEGVQLLDYSRFEGRLAESWSHDEDTLTWTFNLRRGVRGCNGATFNADDVIYTFARAKTVSGAIPVGWFLSSSGSIDGFTGAVFGDDEAKKLGDEVKKIDDYTIQIRQGQPNKLFLPVLTVFGLYMFDKETMEANATDEDPWSHDYVNNVDAPSFGPYCLESWNKDDDFVVTANPNYYRGAAAIERVIYKKIPQSSSRLVILRSGDAQLVEHLTPREYDSLRGTPGVQVAGLFGNSFTWVLMNYKNPPFDNITVRQAIAHAIPYDEIIRVAYTGGARKHLGQLPSTYPGFHASATQYEYDLDKARALLAEAGFPNGEGLDAFQDSFHLFYTSEKETVLGPVAAVIRDSLRDIGITVLLEPIPQTQFSDRTLVKKDIPFGIVDDQTPIVVDAGYMIAAWVSPEHGGQDLIVNYDNTEVDNLFVALKAETDDTRRNGLLAQVQDILQRDLPWMPAVEVKTHWAFADNLKGLTWHADNSVRWYDLRFE